MGPLVDAAVACATELLGEGSERWRHSRGVAERAADLSVTVSMQERQLLVAAAWVHDIGYADDVKDLGFHPVDGGRYLLSKGWDARVAALVAHHSGARFVAGVRGLEGEIASFPFEESPVSDALTYADQTIGPGGQFMQLDERVADVLRRHGPESPNARAHPRRGPYLHEVAARMGERLSEPSGPPACDVRQESSRGAASGTSEAAGFAGADDSRLRR